MIPLQQIPPRSTRRVGALHDFQRRAFAGGDEGKPCLGCALRSQGVDTLTVEFLSSDLISSVATSSSAKPSVLACDEYILCHSSQSASSLENWDVVWQTGTSLSLGPSFGGSVVAVAVPVAAGETVVVRRLPAAVLPSPQQ